MGVQARVDINTTDFVIGENLRALRHDAVTFEQDAGRAAVLAQFTLMAKKPVTVPTTGTADVGNTGDGTVTGVAVAPGGPPRAGSWNLEATAAGELGRVVGSVTADGGNTGDGTVTGYAVVAGEVPEVGNFVLTCTDANQGGTATGANVFTGTGNGTSDAIVTGTEAIEGDYIITCIDATVSGSEIFQVIDPNGNELEQLVVGVAYSNNHFATTINDGSTDFIVGDLWTMTMTIAHGGLFTLTDPNGVALLESITLPGTPAGTVVVTSGGITFTITDGATDFAVDDFFTLVMAVADGGTFKLEDPGGNIVANDIVMSGTSGGATTFIRGGMTFIITDGAADFASGDKFAIVVTVNGDSVPFDISAIDGSEIPTGIFMGTGIAAADLVAADVVDQPVIYSGLKFDEAKLVFDDGVTTLASVMSTGRTVRDELALMDLIASPVDVTTNFENA